MGSEKELKLAYGLAIGLLIAGILCYAASSAEVPKEGPIRMMFQCSTGKVLFDHKTHAAEGGYGIACSDCHHHPADNEDNRACKECHVLPADGSLPALCLDCHGADEVETDAVMQKTDAMHQQCIGCHKEKDAGPKECAECHVSFSM
jgi:hypothetical protein